METTTEKKRYPLTQAESIAGELLAILTPYVERIIVAGSIRRRKPLVGDIEILYVPRLGTGDLFGGDPEDLVASRLEIMLREGLLEKRPNINGATAWGEKNKLAIHVPSGIPVDFFRTAEESWNNYLVCRTGPAESNLAIAREARTMGLKWTPYGPGFESLETGEAYPVFSEKAVFATVGIPFRAPEDRHMNAQQLSQPKSNP
jgi:DNA polymerase/3'-5' exonuclease PolX